MTALDQAAEEMAAVPVNAKVRLHYGADHVGNRLFHVRAHVDDRLVVRRWSRRWKSWEYEVLDCIWWATKRENVSVEER